MIETNYSKSMIKDKANFVFPQDLKTKIKKEQLEELRIPRLFDTVIMGNFNPEQKHLVDRCIHFTTQDEFLPRDANLNSKEQEQISIQVPSTDISYGAQPYDSKKADIWFLINEDTKPTASYFLNLNYLVFHGFHYDIHTGKFNKKKATLAINAVFDKIKEKGYKLCQEHHMRLMIGADPEFSIIDNNGVRQRANDILSNPSTSMTAQIGVDGASQTGELRPTAMDDPIFLVKKEIKRLLYQLKRELPKDLGLTSGGGFEDPLGGHIHFNKLISAEEVILLDDFVGKPTVNMKGGRRAGGGYGSPSDVRVKPHGVEYRTPPSTLIPGVLEAQWVTAFSIIRTWRLAKPGMKFSYEVTQNGTPRLEDYLQFAPTKRYRKYIEDFYTFIKNGQFNIKENILDLWFGRPKQKVETRQPRVVLKNKPEWFKGRSRYAVKGITKQKEIEINTYGPKFIEDKEDIPPQAVILELGLDEYSKVVDANEKFDRICNTIATTLDSNIVVMRADAVRLRHPHTWRSKKQTLVTSNLIQYLTREIFEETIIKEELEDEEAPTQQSGSGAGYYSSYGATSNS